VSHILNILFPKTCPLCGEIIHPKGEICETCGKQLAYIQEPKCKKCGKPFDAQEEEARVREYCPDCVKRCHSYDFGMAVFQYTESVRESIYRFKYHNQRTYAGFYGKAMAKQYGQTILALGVEALIPVPVSAKKKISRGYNQAELIAAELGKTLNLPMENNLLQRIKNTTPQKELNDIERRNNLKNAFKIKENIVKYRKILLVDDIYTTGSTVDACAQVLKTAGVKNVYFITLAIGDGV
jgi:ComF family protein